MGDFPRPHQEAGLPAGPSGITAIWLLPFFRRPGAPTMATISPTTTTSIPPTGRCRDFQKLFLKQAHRRGIRVLTEVVLNHTSDQHPWFQRSRRAAPGTRWRDFLRLERHGRKVQGCPDHLQGLRAVQLDLGPGGQGLLLASLLLAPAGSELRQPARPGSDPGSDRFLVRPGRGRISLGRSAVSIRAPGHQLREPARNACVPQGALLYASTSIRSTKTVFCLAEAKPVA